MISASGPRRSVAADAREDESINIVFGVDKNFAPHMAATIASIVRNAPDAELRFLVLNTGIEKEQQTDVETVAPSARFIWIEVSDDDVPHFADREHFTRAILFRLGLETLAPPDWRRVIYLDSDIILLRDIRELWQVDLGGLPLAAVVDVLVDAGKFAQRWQLPPSNIHYFNSGVLVIDLDVVRTENLFSKAIEFVAQNGSELLYSDQDALNYAVWARWRPLDLIWNVQRDVVYAGTTTALPEDRRLNGRMPALVHFTSEVKPWALERFHPWAWIYWDNLSRTPFAREVASKYGVSKIQRFRLWLRWLRRRPRHQ